MLQLVIFSEQPLKTHSFSSNTLEGHCEPGHAADRVIDLREVLRVSCSRDRTSQRGGRYMLLSIVTYVMLVKW